MLVRGVKLGEFLGSSGGDPVGESVGVERSGHSHHDVVILLVVYISTSGPAEFLATHDSANHLNRAVSGALPRAASAQFDNLGAALCNIDLELLPVLGCASVGADEFVEGLASDLDGAAKNGHLLAVSAIGSAAGNLILLNAELLGDSALEASRVESCESGDLAGFETRVKESNEAGEVGGVEDSE